MRQPIIYTVAQISKWENYRETLNKGYTYARPEGHNLFSLMHRWKVAWRVLCGKYDAVDWKENT